jgi:hypothetical protein
MGLLKNWRHQGRDVQETDPESRLQGRWHITRIFRTSRTATPTHRKTAKRSGNEGGAHRSPLSCPRRIRQNHPPNLRHSTRTEIRQKVLCDGAENGGFPHFFDQSASTPLHSAVAKTSIKPTTCTPTDGGAFISPSKIRQKSAAERPPHCENPPRKLASKPIRCRRLFPLPKRALAAKPIPQV